jgi:hypothetical protein
MRSTLLLVILFSAISLTGCGLSSSQKAVAKEAVDALGKVQAATEVGVTFVNYGPLVIDAKAKANQAKSLLPDGPLKEHIVLAAEAYADAGQVWSEKIQGVGAGEYARIWTKNGVGQTVISKYSIPVEKSEGSAAVLGDSVRADLAMQVIWAKAKEHYEGAFALIQ